MKVPAYSLVEPIQLTELYIYNISIRYLRHDGPSINKHNHQHRQHYHEPFRNSLLLLPFVAVEDGLTVPFEYEESEEPVRSFFRVGTSRALVSHGDT